jgi:hypothetical protein
VRQAGKVEKAVEVFNTEFQGSLDKIQAQQGSPVKQRTVGTLEVSFGGAALVMSYPLARAISLFSEQN